MFKNKMMNVKSLIVLRSLAALAIAALISGCAVPFFSGYGANGQSREDFEHHVEEVFKLQNRMTSEVMMMMESDEVKKPEALLQAEQHMQQICADLNEYVSRDIDGLSTGLFLRRRVEKSAIDCEQAAMAIKPLLKP
ncbi:hypothetical protein [Methylobacter sp.]|uniref:hypothetical protein n=2 Tax=Methylobacter sp. TaxID=2051955 RepID=UPI0024892B78|nr:hypothetical protein [Methylobacter sp.]MDI1278678.1 hypothetical protein [Methylobacter sp.]MDI1359498.1 hypothetical protein [Methylobacter sp.]